MACLFGCGRIFSIVDFAIFFHVTCCYLRRGISSLVSSRLPSNSHLSLESCLHMGLVSGTVCSSGFFRLHVGYKHLVVMELWLLFYPFLTETLMHI